MKESKEHHFVCTFRFNKPISRAEAIREVRNSVWGEFYTDGHIRRLNSTSYPEQFQVRGWKHPKEADS